MNPSGFSSSPVSVSPAVSECRKNPRRRTRGSLTSIFNPPLATLSTAQRQSNRSSREVKQNSARAEQKIWDARTSIADRVIESIRRPIRIGDSTVAVGAIVGVAMGAHPLIPSILIQRADEALLQAKDSGTNTVKIAV